MSPDTQSCEHCGHPSTGYALRYCSFCGDGMCSGCEDIHDDQARCPLACLQQRAPEPEGTPRRRKP